MSEKEISRESEREMDRERQRGEKQVKWWIKYSNQCVIFIINNIIFYSLLEKGYTPYNYAITNTDYQYTI